jgi:LAO/AO transport system kinase
VPSSSSVRAGGGRLPLEQYVEGVLAGDRMVLARAITLIESRLAGDADKAAQLLDSILPHTGKSRRLGITGVPGVGKSTFIDALGMHVIRDCGERLAVLTVDPSSPISGRRSSGWSRAADTRDYPALRGGRLPERLH